MTFPTWWQSHFFQPCSSHHQPVNHHSPKFYHNFWVFGIGDVGYLRIQTTNFRSPRLHWANLGLAQRPLDGSEKWCSSVGVMNFPRYGKIKAMFRTTNQLYFIISYLKLSKIDTDSNIGNRPSNKSTSASLEDRIWIFGWWFTINFRARFDQNWFIVFGLSRFPSMVRLSPCRIAGKRAKNRRPDFPSIFYVSCCR